MKKIFKKQENSYKQPILQNQGSQVADESQQDFYDGIKVGKYQQPGSLLAFNDKLNQDSQCEGGEQQDNQDQEQFHEKSGLILKDNFKNIDSQLDQSPKFTESQIKEDVVPNKDAQLQKCFLDRYDDEKKICYYQNQEIHEKEIFKPSSVSTLDQFLNYGQISKIKVKQTLQLGQHFNQFDTELWDGKIVSLQSTKFPGFYMDANEKGKQAKFTQCEETDLNEKKQFQWKIHKISQELILLESVIFPQHYLDCNHNEGEEENKQKVLVTNSPEKPIHDWAQWIIFKNYNNTYSLKTNRYKGYFLDSHGSYLAHSTEGSQSEDWAQFNLSEISSTQSNKDKPKESDRDKDAISAIFCCSSIDKLALRVQIDSDKDKQVKIGYIFNQNNNLQFSDLEIQDRELENMTIVYTQSRDEDKSCPIFEHEFTQDEYSPSSVKTYEYKQSKLSTNNKCEFTSEPYSNFIYQRIMQNRFGLTGSMINQKEKLDYEELIYLRTEIFQNSNQAWAILRIQDQWNSKSITKMIEEIVGEKFQKNKFAVVFDEISEEILVFKLCFDKELGNLYMEQIVIEKVQTKDVLEQKLSMISKEVLQKKTLLIDGNEILESIQERRSQDCAIILDSSQQLLTMEHDENAVRIFYNGEEVQVIDKKMFTSDLINEPDTFTLFNTGKDLYQVHSYVSNSYQYIHQITSIELYLTEQRTVNIMKITRFVSSSKDKIKVLSPVFLLKYSQQDKQMVAQNVVYKVENENYEENQLSVNDERLNLMNFGKQKKENDFDLYVSQDGTNLFKFEFELDQYDENKLDEKLIERILKSLWIVMNMVPKESNIDFAEHMEKQNADIFIRKMGSANSGADQLKLLDNFQSVDKDEENEEEDILIYSGIESDQIQSVYGLLFNNLPQSEKEELLKLVKLKKLIREKNVLNLFLDISPVDEFLKQGKNDFISIG